MRCHLPWSLVFLAGLALCLAPRLRAERLVGVVNGTAGLPIRGFQWDPADGTLVAACADAILRIDPVTGANRVLYRAPQEEGGLVKPGPNVLEVALGAGGIIDFTRAGLDGDACDPRIWRRYPDGKVEVIAGYRLGREDKGEGALGARFRPTRLARGAGATLLVGDAVNRKLYHLVPREPDNPLQPQAAGYELRTIGGADDDGTTDSDDESDPADPRQILISPLDLAVLADGNVLVANESSRAATALLPDLGPAGLSWSCADLPLPGHRRDFWYEVQRLAVGEDDRIYVVSRPGLVWRYQPEPGQAGLRLLGRRWTAEVIAGCRGFHYGFTHWPAEGAKADRISGSMLEQVVQMVAVPGSLLLSDGRDGIHFILDDDADLVEPLRAHLRERPHEPFEPATAGPADSPRLLAVRCALAKAAVEAERAAALLPAKPALEAYGDRHLWRVPGSQDQTFQAALWSPGRNKITAASGRWILELDPVSGAAVPLHQLPLDPQGRYRDRVSALVLGPDGAIDFMVERQQTGPVAIPIQHRLWRLRHGHARPIACLSGVYGHAQAQVPEAGFAPGILAAGSGGERFLMDASRHQVLALSPPAGQGGATAAACPPQPIAGMVPSPELSAEERTAAVARRSGDPLRAYLMGVLSLASGRDGELLVGGVFGVTRLSPGGPARVPRWQLDPVPLPGDPDCLPVCHPGQGRLAPTSVRHLAVDQDGTVYAAARGLLWAGGHRWFPDGERRWHWQVIGGAGSPSEGSWPAPGAPAKQIPGSCIDAIKHLSTAPGGIVMMCAAGGGIYCLGPARDALLAQRVAAHRQAEAQGQLDLCAAITAALVRQRNEARMQVFDRPFQRLNRSLRDGQASLRAGQPQDLHRLVGSFLIQDPPVLAFRAAMAVEAIRLGSPFEQSRPAPSLPSPPSGPGAGPAATPGGRKRLRRPEGPVAAPGSVEPPVAAVRNPIPYVGGISWTVWPVFGKDQGRVPPGQESGTLVDSNLGPSWPAGRFCNNGNGHRHSFATNRGTRQKTLAGMAPFPPRVRGAHAAPAAPRQGPRGPDARGRRRHLGDHRPGA